MKITRTLILMSASGFFCTPNAEAQTTLLKPAVMRSFGAKRVSVPALHRANVYGCYEVFIPGTVQGTPYSPARMDRPYGYVVQDHVEIAPGVEIRMPNIKNDFNKDFDLEQAAAALKYWRAENRRSIS